MNIEKYKKLREEIRNKSFENKYMSVDWILYYASFFGNIASIFFAFFLWFPSLLKTITLHIADNSLTYTIAVIVTILLLSVVEFLKRGILNIFSSEFIQSNMRLNNKSVIGLFFFSIAILGLSFYFSVNGAVQFSKTSGKLNIEIEANNKTMVDSLIKIGENAKQPINEELISLRKSNKELRDKRDNTPLNQRRSRLEYNQLIQDNEKLIDSNTKKIEEIDLTYKNKIDLLKNEENLIKNKNETNDKGNIVLFLIVSSFIEILIVIGVYFRQLFIHKSFYESEQKLEPIVRKREKYDILLKLVYKNGEINQDDQVISSKNLTGLVRSRGINCTIKHVQDFYAELTHLNIFEINTNKRYASVSYEEAKKILNALEEL